MGQSVAQVSSDRPWFWSLLRADTSKRLFVTDPRVRIFLLSFDALLRAALHPLDSVLCSLPELLQQLHPARLVPGHRSWHAGGAATAFLVSPFSAAAAAADHCRRAESLRPTHQFDRRALLWGR